MTTSIFFHIGSKRLPGHCAGLAKEISRFIMGKRNVRKRTVQREKNGESGVLRIQLRVVEGLLDE